jgi:hypothetical protein
MSETLTKKDFINILDERLENRLGALEKTIDHKLGGLEKKVDRKLNTRFKALQSIMNTGFNKATEERQELARMTANPFMRIEQRIEKLEYQEV